MKPLTYEQVKENCKKFCDKIGRVDNEVIYGSDYHVIIQGIIDSINENIEADKTTIVIDESNATG